MLTCYTVVLGNPAGKNIGIIRQGMSGYYATKHDFGSDRDAEPVIREMNEQLGISKEVQLAMELGSMFGWDIPACDCLKAVA